MFWLFSLAQEHTSISVRYWLQNVKCLHLLVSWGTGKSLLPIFHFHHPYWTKKIETLLITNVSHENVMSRLDCVEHAYHLAVLFDVSEINHYFCSIGGSSVYLLLFTNRTNRTTKKTKTTHGTLLLQWKWGKTFSTARCFIIFSAGATLPINQPSS